MHIYQAQPGKIQQQVRKKLQKKKCFQTLKFHSGEEKKKNPKKYKQQTITLTTAVFQQVDRFYSFKKGILTWQRKWLPFSDARLQPSLRFET